MSDGNTLWAWQSEDHPGRWSIIAMFLATPEQAQRAHGARDSALLPEAGRLQVLVHRKREVIEAWRPLAELHGQTYKQAIRLARFDLAEATPL